MTPQGICTLALAMLSQTPEESEDLMALSPAWLTVLCAECLDTENSIRRQKGAEPLAAAPVITAEEMDKPLDMAEAICRIALPYGLAACYYADDDNDYRAADYRARFVGALAEATRMKSEEIKDVYGGEA